MEHFRKELTDLINRHSLENGSDTPDYILAHFIEKSIEAFDCAVTLRSKWYNSQNKNNEISIKEEIRSGCENIFDMLKTK